MEALEKSPARHYPSVAELAGDVRRHLAHQPVSAGRPGAFYRLRKFVRRNLTAVAAGALIAASAVAGAFGIVSGRLDSMAAARVTAALRPFADASVLTQLTLQHLHLHDEHHHHQPEAEERRSDRAPLCWPEAFPLRAKRAPNHREERHQPRDPHQCHAIASRATEVLEVNR